MKTFSMIEVNSNATSKIGIVNLSVGDKEMVITWNKFTNTPEISCFSSELAVLFTAMPLLKQLEKEPLMGYDELLKFLQNDGWVLRGE